VRKLIVLLGLCMLPSIANAVSGGSESGTSSVVDIRSIESFFLGSPSSSPSAESRRHRSKKKAFSTGWQRSRAYANVLAKLWVAGLSMAWMNTALGFILPVTVSAGVALYSGEGVVNTWLRVISTICLAILSRSLKPMFPELSMFQGYMEWNIATSMLASIRLSAGASGGVRSTSLAVVCTGLWFYMADAAYRDVCRNEAIADARAACTKKNSGGGSAGRGSSAVPSAASELKLSSMVQTLQSVGIIMFTNSLVSWCMEVISAGKGGMGNAVATIVAGIVMARVIVQVVDSGKGVGK
jgi:hypothetical protein